MKNSGWIFAGRIVVGIFFAFMLGVIVFSGRSQLPPTSSFAVQSAAHNFGECTPGDVLRHTFVIRNPLECPCKIEKVAASCSCLVAGQKEELVGQLVAPQGSIEVPMIFPTAGRIGKVEGVIVLTVMPQPSDADPKSSDRLPGGEKIVFRIFAYLPPDLASVPGEVDFGTIDSDSTPDPMLVRLRVSRPDVTYEFSRITDDLFKVESMAENQLAVFVDPVIAHRRSSGPVKAFAEFRVANSGQDKFFLPIGAVLTNTLTVEPPFLSYLDGKSSKTIVLTGALPFRVTQISINGSRQDQLEDSPAVSWELPISLPDSAPREGVVEFNAEFAGSKKTVVRQIQYFKLGE